MATSFLPSPLGFSSCILRCFSSDQPTSSLGQLLFILQVSETLHLQRISWFRPNHLKVLSIFSSVQSISRVRLFVTPSTAACRASLSITNSRTPPKPMSIESVMPSNHLILCRPLLLLPSIFPSIRVFSSESVLRIRWPKYWSFSFNISASNEHLGLISFRMDWLNLLESKGL